MDKLSKALKKFTPQEQKKIKEIISLIKNNSFSRLEIKKLKSRDDVYRIRKGKIRIIYRIDNQGVIFILAVERRSDITYNF